MRFLVQVEFLVIPEVLRPGKLGIAPKNIADVRPLASVFPDRELSKTRKETEDFLPDMHLDHEFLRCGILAPFTTENLATSILH